MLQKLEEIMCGKSLGALKTSGALSRLRHICRESTQVNQGPVFRRLGVRGADSPLRPRTLPGTTPPRV